ncbi:MAG: hypothetical protein ACKPI8_21675, partial [Microcystis panniformis]
NQVEQAIVQPVGCVSDSVTHQFNNRGGALRRLVNFGFLTELIAANTHPTPYRFNNSPVGCEARWRNAPI